MHLVAVTVERLLVRSRAALMLSHRILHGSRAVSVRHLPRKIDTFRFFACITGVLRVCPNA